MRRLLYHPRRSFFLHASLPESGTHPVYQRAIVATDLMKWRPGELRAAERTCNPCRPRSIGWQIVSNSRAYGTQGQVIPQEMRFMCSSHAFPSHGV
jgi:hypothetical protein